MKKDANKVEVLKLLQWKLKNIFLKTNKIDKNIQLLKLK